jgi:3D (Asp-Asp-Asp) domain-containing protein
LSTIYIEQAHDCVLTFYTLSIYIKIIALQANHYGEQAVFHGMIMNHNLLKYAGWTCALVAVALTGGCASIRPPAGVKPVEKKLLTTAYCKCQPCCGWERSWFGGTPVYAYGPLKGKSKKVGITASGTRAKKGTISADLSIYPFNTIMYIPDYGYGRVEDCGSGIKGDHIELFFSSHKKALKWGKKNRNVKIWMK